MITLYYTAKTRAQRVRWLLEECQLDYRLKHIDLFNGEGFSDEYLRINPLGQVPVLQDGDTTQSETGAICHYITQKYATKQLKPDTQSTDYMKYLQWMYFVSSTLEPPLWEIQLHSWILPKEKRSSEAIKIANERYDPIVKVVNNELSNKPYLLGEKLSTADLLLSSCLAWHKKSLRKYPVLSDYVEKLFSRPAYLRALEV